MLIHRWHLRVAVALSVGLGVWTSGETQRLTWLGTLGGYWNAALGVSADGCVVVGWAEKASSH
ncbi:MAG: hypothetical protein RMK45_00085 [Armatimonadota bacterium]|nr:hypothetical protein [Armatimonadota bacterium]